MHGPATRPPRLPGHMTESLASPFPIPRPEGTRPEPKLAPGTFFHPNHHGVPADTIFSLSLFSSLLPANTPTRLSLAPSPRARLAVSSRSHHHHRNHLDTRAKMPHPRSPWALAFLVLTATATAADTTTPSLLPCAKLPVSDHVYDLSPLAGPHTLVTTEFAPPSHYNTTWALDLCGPLVRKDAGGEGDKKGFSCPEGASGTSLTFGAGGGKGRGGGG